MEPIRPVVVGIKKKYKIYSAESNRHELRRSIVKLVIGPKC